MNDTTRRCFIVGLDGSQYSLKGLDLAAEYGASRSTPIIGIYVRHHPSALAASTVAAGAHRLALDALANDIETDMLLHLANYPGSWKFETRDGDPAHKLIEAATDHGAKLVVVGHRGHNPITELLIGSVAAALVRNSPVSMLLAR